MAHSSFARAHVKILLHIAKYAQPKLQGTRVAKLSVICGNTILDPAARTQYPQLMREQSLARLLLKSFQEPVQARPDLQGCARERPRKRRVERQGCNARAVRLIQCASLLPRRVHDVSILILHRKQSTKVSVARAHMSVSAAHMSQRSSCRASDMTGTQAHQYSDWFPDAD